MNKEIKDLRIVITGASGYIGSQLVKKLDSIGCNLAIIKRDNSDLTALYNIKNKLNIYVYDNSGKKFIEGMSGLWCASLGFSEKKLADAALKQMNTLPFYHSFAGKVPDVSAELSVQRSVWSVSFRADFP